MRELAIELRDFQFFYLNSGRFVSDSAGEMVSIVSDFLSLLNRNHLFTSTIWRPVQFINPDLKSPQILLERDCFLRRELWLRCLPWKISQTSEALSNTFSGRRGFVWDKACWFNFFSYYFFNSGSDLFPKLAWDYWKQHRCFIHTSSFSCSQYKFQNKNS